MTARLPFLRETAFPPEVVHAMSVALDDTCRELRLPATAPSARAMVARRLVELARRGEHDAVRLRELLLREAGRKR
jgi:hypothetical protein